MESIHMTTSGKHLTDPGEPIQPQSPPSVDNQRVSDLFTEYKTAHSTAQKTQIISQICSELTMPSHGEEDIFFPKVKLVLKDNEWILEATVEHAGLKALIAQIEGIEPDSKTSSGKIRVLSEYMKQRVKNERPAIAAEESLKNSMQEPPVVASVLESKPEEPLQPSDQEVPKQNAIQAAMLKLGTRNATRKKTLLAALALQGIVGK
jgi:hypothetical protein